MLLRTCTPFHIIILLFIYSILTSSGMVYAHDSGDRKTSSEYIAQVQIPGTKIYINQTEEYRFIPEVNLLMKDSANYIVIVDIPGRDFHVAKEIVLENFKNHNLESENKYEYIEFEFKGYDALFGIDSTAEDQESIIVLFGDSTFSVMASACHPKDPVERDEILDLMLSMKYNPDEIPDYESNLNLELDLDSSDFAILTAYGPTGIYTIGGQPNNSENIFASSFVAGTIIPDPSFDLVEHSHDMLESYKDESGKEVEIIVYSREFTTTGDTSHYSILFGMVIDGREMKCLQYMNHSPEGVVQFSGQDASADLRYIAQFEYIIDHLRWKED